MPAKKAKKKTIAKNPKKVVEKEVKKKVKKEVKKQQVKLRTPIVAVMGHVDHGKTSLLDAIRDTSVQAGEVGGITQNTRSHSVKLGQTDQAGEDGPSENGIAQVTFIDTPGHEAFAQMRSRGARVADIAMLVVAADDGVQPQTKQSIEFIKQNNLPVVVAANKTDLPGANLDKLKQQLSSADLLVEDYGGEAVLVPVSAVEKTGLDELLEAITLVAELNEIKQIPPAQGVAEGFVLESNLDTDLGPVALVITKAGQVQRGQYVVADGQVHKIRAALNESQQQIEHSRQGDPVWIIGLSEVLAVGQNLVFFDDKSQAEDVLAAAEAARREREAAAAQPEALSDADALASLLQQQEESAASDTNLKVILKADTQGTLEAIEAKIEELSYEEARISIFSAETGNISERDVETARDIKGIVLGFQIKIDKQAEILSQREKVLVRTYEIIYDMLDELDAVVQSMIAPEEEIEEVAVAHVKKVFTLSDGKLVAGCEVTKGTLTKGYNAYVRRGGEGGDEIGEGKITSLKHLKDEVKEAKKGTECGIMLEPQVKFEEGDEIITFKKA